MNQQELKAAAENYKSNLKLYSLRDRKQNTFKAPATSANIAVLTRDLTEVINNNAESPLSKHSEDYELYEIGEFDEITGKITPSEHPDFILTLSELKGDS